jgi:capsular polysaccharide transport system ATP-binding protein
VITLDNVTKAYAMTGGRKVVLQDATAAFMPGHNYGVLGINGAGKSTLIRLLAGSEMPDRGRIRRHARVSFPLGFGGTFHGTLTGRENVAFIARIYGAGVRHTTRYVEDFAELGGYFRYYGAKDQSQIWSAAKTARHPTLPDPPQSA